MFVKKEDIVSATPLAYAGEYRLFLKNRVIIHVTNEEYNRIMHETFSSNRKCDCGAVKALREAELCVHSHAVWCSTRS